MPKGQRIAWNEIDPGIRRMVRALSDGGVHTVASCEGRRNPGYRPRRDGPHHGDWPYVTIHGTSAHAFLAMGIALREGFPVRSIEQGWFVYSESPTVPIGPEWRITFWEKDEPE